MNQNTLLQNSDNHVKLDGIVSPSLTVVCTDDKRLAKQLADHHFALAQAYLKLAGEQPVMTGSQMRKLTAQVTR